LSSLAPALRSGPVALEWSVFVIAAIMLAGAARRPLVTLVGLPCWLGVLLIHESGHLLTARWRGCLVDRIQLYPFFGFTAYEIPWSRLDHCLIAWGGVLAQAVVAVPVVAWLAVFGYSGSDALDTGLAILGPFSLGVAAFNLLPLWKLDGATAWGLIPALFQRRKSPGAWRR
jgi:Zn-dependent protease